MNQFNLEGLGREELTDLLAAVMFRLRQVEAEDIKSDFITKSQKLRLEMDAKEKAQADKPPHNPS